MDMSAFIAPKSDQLNADDLIAGPRTITVTSVRGTDAADQPVAIHYEGDGGKPYKPCKSMRRVMVHCWGKNAAGYVGKSMELYCDPEVMFGGMKVGGIRIRSMSHIDGPKQMALTATRGKKAPYKVQPLADAPQPTAERTDFSAELSQLRGVARPGNLTVLQETWGAIGAPARKALAGELDGLKALCASAPQPDDDDVPFGGSPEPQPQGAGYDGV